MQNKLITIALLTAALAAHAETFPMTNLPQGWTGSINVAQCAEGKCAGKGEVRLTLGKQTHTLPADFHEFSAPKAQGAAPLVNPITIDDLILTAKTMLPCRAGIKDHTAQPATIFMCKQPTANWFATPI